LTINAVVHAQENGYVAECLEVAVVTQGDTLDELVRNLDEAVSLYLEGEDLNTLGLSEPLHMRLTFDVPLNLTR
jgi:predicted RNase H-like HicB family nuclease